MGTQMGTQMRTSMLIPMVIPMGRPMGRPMGHQYSTDGNKNILKLITIVINKRAMIFPQ